MLAVTIESRPLDVFGLARPVEGGVVALMTDSELAAFMLARQADHEGSKLEL